MRVVVTGGAGLRRDARGRAAPRSRRRRSSRLVRDPAKAHSARRPRRGARRRTTSPTSARLPRRTSSGADARHPRRGQLPRSASRQSERPAMWDANVGTTTRVLEAAEAAGVPRIVYVSTVNVFGNTHGRIVDETYRRDLTRRLPQLVRRDQVPGPRGRRDADRGRRAGRDHDAEPGLRPGRPDRLRRTAPARLRGAACRTARSPTCGIGLVHADDLAAGIVAALDRGEDRRGLHPPGRRITTLDEAVGDRGRRSAASHAPRLALPDGLLRADGAVRPPRRASRTCGEVISASAGVTYLGVVGQGEARAGLRAARRSSRAIRDTFAGA